MRRAFKALLIAAVVYGFYLLGMALTAGCAAHSPPVAGTDQHESWRDMPQTTNRLGGLGHLCPYDQHLAYATRHATLDYFGDGPWFVPLMWGCGSKGGRFYPLYLDATRDLTVGCSDRPFPRWFERATEPPKVGDRAFVASYDWTKKGAPREQVELRIADIVGGLIRFEESPAAGSSNGCVLDQQGRIIAVMSAGLLSLTSWAPAVWGEWGEVPPEWRDSETYGWVGAQDAAKGCAADVVR